MFSLSKLFSAESLEMSVKIIRMSPLFVIACKRWFLPNALYWVMVG